jgi:hypothetical protein
MTLAFALGFGLAGGLFLAIGYFAARRAVTDEDGVLVGSSATRSVPAVGVPTNGAASAASSATPGPPVQGYDEMSGRQVTRLVESGALNRQQLGHLLGYEASHQARKTVLDKVEAAVLALAKEESTA